MEELSIPIIQQPRLALVMPVVIVVAAVIGANLLWFVARAVGAPRGVGGIVAVLCLLGGIGLAIWSSVGPQGWVRVDGRGALEVDARWRSARRIGLTGAEIHRFVWSRGGPPPMLVGVYVRVSGSGEAVTIGASDPGLAPEFGDLGAEPTTVPPSVSVAPPDFRKLLETLPMPSGAGGEA